jgi:antitoxin (DNA-binding transcriptional repressor) of toxin-antitoxin stability system
MRSVGIKVLKNKLSQYIRIAAQGETVLVTDRDRVVAEITPPRAGRGEAVTDAVLAEAVRNGWVAPPVIGRRAMPRMPVASLEEILKDLVEQRGDR